MSNVHVYLRNNIHNVCTCLDNACLQKHPSIDLKLKNYRQANYSICEYFIHILFSKNKLHLGPQIKLWEGVGLEMIRRKIIDNIEVQNIYLQYSLIHRVSHVVASILSSKKVMKGNLVEQIDIDIL